MEGNIWKFWTSNPKFWIPITDAEKAAADKAIFATFYNYSSLHEEEAIGQIIYYDQFFRHFQRVLPTGSISEADIKKYRLKAEEILSSSWTSIKESIDPDLIVWALMPLKHLERWDLLFTYLHDCNHSLSTGLIAKFYQDSYRKAYTDAVVASKIVDNHEHVYRLYDADSICDSYPEGFHGLPTINITEEGDLAATRLNKALSTLDISKPITVSLSGGVDSMVMITLLKHAGYTVNAIHIVYGNRPESAQEYAFIATFCSNLSIPLKVYKIEWLRRDTSEREFYEEMTKQLRFMVYRIAAPGQPILLGHINEDVIENIWTNIATVQHLNNLKKMSKSESLTFGWGRGPGEVRQHGITLLRPFLEQDKETIYQAAKAFAVPYLKNTTPSWSNRGKFREHFHEALKVQFGPGIDKKIIQFADNISKQSEILDNILFQPMFRTWNEETKTLDIWAAVSAKLDVWGWSTVFEYICHEKLGINKPSGRCIAEFVKRMKRPCYPIKFHMHMHKHLQIKVDDINMVFII